MTFVLPILCILLAVSAVFAPVYILLNYRPVPVPRERVVSEATLRSPWFVSSDGYTRTLTIGCIQAQVSAETTGIGRPAPLSGRVVWEVGIRLPRRLADTGRGDEGYLCVASGGMDHEADAYENPPVEPFSVLSERAKETCIMRLLDVAQEKATERLPCVVESVDSGISRWITEAT